MELHVWARLDEMGQIQSVQSTCSRTPDNRAPPPLDNTLFDIPAGKGDVPEKEKFVPYVVKKDLVKRLDTKLDEMALMVMQMAELSEKNKLQEKLIVQYEGRIRDLQKQLELARAELAQRPKSSENEPSENARRLTRNSSTSIKLVCSVETSETSSLNELEKITIQPCDRTGVDGDKYVSCDPDPEYHAQKAQNDLSKQKETLKEDILAKVHLTRPSTLNINCEVSNSVTSNETDSDALYYRAEGTNDRNGYSYVKSPVLVLPVKNKKKSCVKDHSRDGSESSLSKQLDYADRNTPPPHSEIVDNTGYLIFPKKNSPPCSPPCTPPPSETTDDFDFTDLSVDGGDSLSWKESLEELSEKEVKRRIPYLSLLEPEVTSTNGMPLSPPKHKLVRNHIYDEIVDHDASPERPPKAAPRRQKSKCDDAATSDKDSLSSMETSISCSSSCHSSGSTSLSESPTSTSPKINQRTIYTGSGMPVRTSTYPTKFTPSFPAHAQFVGTTPDKNDIKMMTLPHDTHVIRPDGWTGSHTSPPTGRVRSNSTPDLNKPEDQLNIVLKDMRTTMEWNQEKQNIVFRNTSCTAQQAEQQLTSAVQKIHSAFQNAFMRSRKKVMQWSVATLTKKLASMYKDDFGVSDDFWCKCLSLTRDVMPKVKTP